VGEAELATKLQRLEATGDAIERNRLALDLAETRDRRVFDCLVGLIQRPELANQRGTLIYCLEDFDCSSVADLLAKLAETGNFEVAIQAEIILDKQVLW
jgi:hypothetical protein